MISIIGEQWSIAQDPANTNKPHPDDWVGTEIAIALKRGIKIVPILVESAKMPHAKDIPKEISAISLFNAINIKFNQHTDNGIEKLKATIQNVAPNIKKKTELTLSSKIEDAIKIISASSFAALLAFSNPTAEDHIKKIQRGAFSDWKLYSDIFYENNIVFSTANAILNNNKVVLSYGFLSLIIESKEYEQIQQNIGRK